MSTFQSYVITGPSKDSLREETTKLAKRHAIDINKSSPDIFFIAPVKNSIIIDQIRELKAHIFQKPLKEKFKFVIIENADSAKAEAQNALLKILEEPPTQAILVLESSNNASLLPTILSRVITIKVKNKSENIEEIFAEENIENALLKISDIENPKQFIDSQLIALSEKLIADIKSGKKTSKQTTSLIEQYKEAKQMIIQNVNPASVLTNLIIATNSASM